MADGHPTNERGHDWLLGLFLFLVLACLSEAFSIATPSTSSWNPPTKRRPSAYLMFSTTIQERSLEDTTKAQERESLVSTEESEGILTATSSTKATSLLEIASSITQEQCQLLGVKSLGVDYGLSRTGVAVSTGYNPKPLAILSNFVNQTKALCDCIVQYAKVEQVQTIVVGLPLHKNGTVGEQTNLTVKFAEELACAALSELGPNVPVELWDERYTSKEAAARAHAKDPHRVLYGSLDADAACIILEHFYSDNGKGRLTVQVSDPLRRESCMAQYNTKRMQQVEKRQNASKERVGRLQQRRMAIAQAQRIERQHDGEEPGRSRKKKKKKRRK